MNNFITYIKIYPQHNKGKVLASVMVKTSIGITLTNLSIVLAPNGNNGMIVTYPPNPYYVGEEVRAIFYPESKQVRDYIEKAVIEKYMDMY